MGGAGEECRMDGQQSGVWRESVVVPRVPSRVNVAMFNIIETCMVDLHSSIPRVYHPRVANEKCMSLQQYSTIYGGITPSCSALRVGSRGVFLNTIQI